MVLEGSGFWRFAPFYIEGFLFLAAIGEIVFLVVKNIY
ncbi:hypothetical protein UCMB321_3114 [Pseudomonas batumici]|uniref:Uncharacterized protein n=1 Tax=Pseudomonas batumici TaxID=226910 RepID=A0A0C2EBD7_9PSED|nr:hypothetical protein UCMB321_3114 [Pseudomonas batumici]